MMLAKFRLSSVPNVVELATKGPMTRTMRTEEAVERLTLFMQSGNVAVLTGAGVSVDSGIQAYRGRDGMYGKNPQFK